RRDSVTEADLVELRLDSVSDPNVAAALEGRLRPTIVTCRPTWEGGNFDGSEEERERLLAEALALGAEYVDVEWKANFHGRLIEGSGSGHQIVLSTHDFAAMPRDLVDRAREMRATGAGTIKIAVAAERLSDCAALMGVGAEIGRGGPSVVIAMGDRGVASRVVPDRFGSVWTYAGSLSAVGQLDA